MKRTLLGSAVLMISLAGCTNYYKVTDPTTGRVYYTTELSQKGSGASTLKDARTGNTVTVQSSEVQKIEKEEFERGKYAEPAATPTKTTM
jgi:hypothetical protein